MILLDSLVLQLIVYLSLCPLRLLLMASPLLVRPYCCKALNKPFQPVHLKLFLLILDVLCLAPQAMVAAGFGDMLGKYTSLADWKLGQLLLEEHYCEIAADMTMAGLQLCIDHIDGIRDRNEIGIKSLMEGLILSGISMLLVGNSRPASGAEHHLSHYWEMRFILEERKALLHGAKVGVACILMAGLFECLVTIDAGQAENLLFSSAFP